MRLRPQRCIILSTLLMGWGALTGQIEINSEHLPAAGNSLMQLNVLLSGDFDFEATGANYVWILDQEMLTIMPPPVLTECVDVVSTPLVYQLFFNNPFDPEHRSDFAVGVESFSFGTFSFEDVYSYYQNREDRYAITGSGATINDIPTGALGDPVDVIYEFPLQYGDEGEYDSELTYEVPTLGTYNTIQHRRNECDGWGTMSVGGVPYDVLRIRTELSSSDSIYIELLQTGQRFDLPPRVEYKWLCQEFKVPLLEVVTSAGVVTTVRIADLFTSVKEEVNTELLFTVTTGPNGLIIQGDIQNGDSIRIHDVNGRIVRDERYMGSPVSTAGMNSGYYFCTVSGQGLSGTKGFVLD